MLDANAAEAGEVGSPPANLVRPSQFLARYNSKESEAGEQGGAQLGKGNGSRRSKGSSHTGRGMSVSSEADEDPHLIYKVPTFRDIHTELEAFECVLKLREGIPAVVCQEDAKRTVAVEAFSAHIVIDRHNGRLEVALRDLKTGRRKKGQLSLPVGEFREVRHNRMAAMPNLLDKSRALVSEEDLSKWRLTLLYGTHLMHVKYLSIVLRDEEAYKILATALKGLVRAAHSVRIDPTKRFLKEQYLNMADKTDRIAVRTLTRTMAGRKKVLRKDLQRHMADMGLEADKRKHLTMDDFPFSTFTTLHNEMEHRDDIRRIFLQLSDEKEHLTREEFLQFLTDEQGLPVSLAQQMHGRYECDALNLRNGQLSFDGFANYLLSKDGDAYDSHNLDAHQDMDLPMNQYFINSSHNTYLTGHQLTSVSSVEMYIQALLHSCRSVEIDCWDGPNGSVVVYHGYTLTTKIPFESVIEAIHKYAFKSSPYPVILSLEDHCSIPQQELMAKILRDTFGDSLIDHDVRKVNVTWDRVNPNLPSPKQLKHKILIKHKKRPSGDGEADAQSVVRNISKEMEQKAAGNGGLDTSALIAEEDNDLVDDADLGQIQDIQRLRKQGLDVDHLKNYEGSKSGLNVAQDISDLVVYFESVKFKGFAAASQNCTQMSSFSENRSNKIVKKHAREWVKYNIKQTSRVYPQGTRFDSSNYNPMSFWACGCQMVAMNFQTVDTNMLLNMAMFEQNGGTGYVLKPSALQKRTGIDPNSSTSDSTQARTTLSIDVISAQHVQRRGASKALQVTVQLLGIRPDCREVKTSKEPGSHPFWNQTIDLDNLVLPELVMVKFSIGDLQRIIPYTALLTGYRHVSLRDQQNVPVPLASLFIRVQKLSIAASLDEADKAEAEPAPDVFEDDESGYGFAGAASPKPDTESEFGFPDG